MTNMTKLITEIRVVTKEFKLPRLPKEMTNRECQELMATMGWNEFMTQEKLLVTLKLHPLTPMPPEPN